MLYFIPWVVLILAVIIAVPVTSMMSPGAKRPKDETEEGEMMVEGEEEAMVLEDDFGGEPIVEPVGEDAFAEFN